jgi:hypothetical protein
MATDNTKENVEITDSGYNKTFAELHPAQVELVTWLSSHRLKTGLTGKRNTEERDFQDTSQVNQHSSTRRRVVVHKSKT